MITITLFITTFFLAACGSRIVPENNFLENSEINPSKLIFQRDSLNFKIKGEIPIISALSPKNPRVEIEIRGSNQQVNLGNVELQKELGKYTYEENFTIQYQSWMEGAVLEAIFYQGKDQISPSEKKILAKGVITTPLLVKVGAVRPDEPIPQVGLYIPTGSLDKDLTRYSDFSFFFSAGSSKVVETSRNKGTLDRLKNFILQYPSISGIKITGTQSPENTEGKNSKLGMDRAEATLDYLKNSNIRISDSLLDLSSRWNDWFDFRLLLRDYEKLSTQRKDQFYSVLLNGQDYLSQADDLRRINGFREVSRDLFPKLRAAKVEIQAKPIAGLDQQQAAQLKAALESSGLNSGLSAADWAIAGESSPRLEDKEEIYSKMTELFRSALPYNNLAVVKMRQAQRTMDPKKKSLLWEEANRLLDQALRIENNPYVLHNQGQILVLQGRVEEAYKKLSDASVLTKNGDFIRLNESLRGSIDIMRGDYKLATLRFQYQYSTAQDFFNKGLAYFMSGDYSNASISFEESVTAGRSFGYGYYGLALIAVKSGQDEVALIHLKQAIDKSEVLYQKALIDPEFEELRQTKAFFEIFKQDF
ncbi:tetratricopeptide repeat protein [Algoriphagus lutimaris]|uniref:tetratricopeptide repeat protein n=1 Tax=Algoriphagus lutimaris TaxID=613197 RepID=UPI00196B1006|nr:tetratricopeptide repeat protein [Algoriphagus lutimaris]MBN3521866.1 tetratricopeptide repeat protein [Algoriphagus lutimaris]